MDRLQKQEHIDFVKGIFANSESLVLSSIEGLNTTQLVDLRTKLHESDISFKVIKNKLANLAIKGTDAEDMSQDFVGSTAIAWSESDAVTPAKILVKFAKKNKKFKVKSGFNSSTRLDVAGVKALSKLPSLEELRAQLLGLLQAVRGKLLAQTNAPAQNIVGLIQAKSDKDKEEA